MLIFFYVYAYIKIALNAVCADIAFTSYSHSHAAINTFRDGNLYSLLLDFISFCVTIRARLTYYFTASVAIWTLLDDIHKAISACYPATSATVLACLTLAIFTAGCIACWARHFLIKFYLFFTTKNSFVKLQIYRNFKIG